MARPIMILATSLCLVIFLFIAVLDGTRPESSDEEIEEEESESGLHDEYYTQVFKPLLSHGEDHRLSHEVTESLAEASLPATGVVTESLAEASLPATGVVTESLAEASLPATGVVTESLAEVSVHAVQRAVVDKQAECGVCIWAIIYVVQKCCGHEHGSRTLRCDPHSKPCEDELNFVFMKDLFLKGKDGKKPWKDMFYHVWDDLAALGQLLRLWERRRPSLGSDAEAAFQLCREAVTETFDCLGDLTKIKKGDCRESRPKLPNSAVAVQDHREAQCTNVPCPTNCNAQPWQCKLPEHWKTDSFCTNVPFPSLGNVVIPVNNARMQSHDWHQDDHHTGASEQVAEADAELGFPELKIKYGTKAVTSGVMWKTTSHVDAWILAEGEGEPNDQVSKCLNEIEGQQENTLAAFLGNGKSSKMVAGLCIFLRGTQGAWYLENVPSKVGGLLKSVYDGGNTVKGMVGNVGKAVLNVENNLQDLCFAHGKFSYAGDTVEAYEVTDKVKLREQIKHYMEEYNVDLTEVRGLEHCTKGDDCIQKAVNHFKTYNHFFFRKLAPGKRTFMCYSQDAETCKHVDSKLRETQTLVSPADGRVMAFQNFNAQATGFWVKGEQFILENLVKFTRASDYRYYDGGTVLIVRLAPQDYHRFHFPVDGKITSFENYPGNYYSVNPIAVQSKNEPVFTTNKRMHATISSDEKKEFGCVTYISVGATNVASVRHTSYVGQEVHRGMEHGFMAFGGSTVIVVVRAGVMKVRKIVEEMSSIPVETIVQTGEMLGELVEHEHADRKHQRQGSTSPCDPA